MAVEAPVKAPGGLVTLAVLNFVLAGSVALILLMVLSKGWYPYKLLHAIELVAAAVVCLLLIVSGVGYLTCSRIAGRMMGNAFAVLSCANFILLLILDLLESNVSYIDLGEMLFLAYAIVTLGLINGPYRLVFQNRHA